MQRTIKAQGTLGAIIALCVFLLANMAFAGTTGKISGHIADAETNQGLPGVNVLIVGTDMGAATDEDGDYYIVNIPPGSFTVEANMIGYEAIRKEQVRVSVDHTTPVNFSLTQTALTGEEVTVTAEREVIKMDVSASQISSNAEEIQSVPLVRDVQEFINLQAGIENNIIRGGGLDQTQFMVDGLTVVDNRTNEPLQMVNLSAIKEINIIKGGFQAEYGNVRSGVINIVTKDPPANKFTGSLDYRYTLAHRKHAGYSIFDPNNYFLRPYLDPAVAMDGTNSGAWDDYTQQQYKYFEGWKSVAAKDARNLDSDPSNDVTPQDLQNKYIWLHRAQGADQLVPAGYDGPARVGAYGNKPDTKLDASLGGPIPFLNNYLGDLRFFASYSDDEQTFALPTSRDYYGDTNGMVKLISKVTPQLKVSLDGLFGETKTVARRLNGDPPGYMSGPMDIIWSGEDRIKKGEAMYYPGALNPYNIYRNVYGLSVDHVLSPSTFYQLRFSFVNVRQRSLEWLQQRDPSIVTSFGGAQVDESPYGVMTAGGPLLMQDGMYYGAHSAGARDSSNSMAFNLKFDFSSQVNKYHQLKFGLVADYDDIYTYQEKNRWESVWENWYIRWHEYPHRMGAYVQDKLEFEGMIANFGVRMDYNDPNTQWFSLADPYSKYFKSKYKSQLLTDAPQTEAKGHVKFSPRLGISHPISANSKLYFNYGHFYSMPPSVSMYEIQWGRASRSVAKIGDPSADLPKTVAYELGWDFSLWNTSFQISGYYKDVTAQTNDVWYTSFDGQVDYQRTENNNYEDIRGFEIRIDKRWGRWISGWLNYNYIVDTHGYIGREHYYEDPREQRIEGLQNPYQEVPVARPYAHASLMFFTPEQFGPSIANFKPLANLRLNLLFHYKSGRFQTWDPLDTRELQDNLHWKSEYLFDLRFSKMTQVAGVNTELFLDINNVFNSENWSSQAFSSSDDERTYLESLHLPMYNDPAYEGMGYTGGNDKPGDLRSKDKPYINDPNLGYLMYLDPRSVLFGLRIMF
ncbi:MAG: TonB-dependent receptor [Calditrichota bacterium]